VALLQGRDEELLDPGEECLAVHWAIDDAWPDHAVMAQGSNEGGCFPVPVRNRADQPLAPGATAVKPGHLGGGAALVDEDQTFLADVRLTGAPLRARLGHIGPILLCGSQ